MSNIKKNINTKQKNRGKKDVTHPEQNKKGPSLTSISVIAPIISIISSSLSICACILNNYSSYQLFINYLQTSNYNTAKVSILFVVPLLATIVLDYAFSFLKDKYNFLKLAFIFVAISVITYSMLPLLVYPFKINEPKNGSYVDYQTTVSGQGAIPGSPVALFTIGESGHQWEIGTAIPTQDGSWECNNVNIGQYGSQYSGQSFTIFANLTKDNKTYQTPHISVTRF